MIVGAGLTLVTAGVSDVAAGAAAGAEVASVVGRILGWIADLAVAVGRVIDGLAESATVLARVAGISERMTVRVVTMAGRSVVSGVGGAAADVGEAAISDPETDLGAAALQGFIAGAALGGLGTGAGLTGTAAANRALTAVRVPGAAAAIPARRFAATYERSVHNPEAERVMLGKYDGGGPTSYIRQAGDSHTYFDMGDEFGRIEKKYRIDDGNMFDLYNARFLDDAMAQGKDFPFSHDPRLYPNSALDSELIYLRAHGYRFNPSTMTATKRGISHDE